MSVVPPDDLAEREADRVADAVMRTPVDDSTPAVHRKCDECEQDDTPVHRSATAGGGIPAPPLVSQVVSEPGRPLSAETRAFFEPRFGLDLSGVSVRDDARAAASADAVSARAYTVGDRIVFNVGEYAPQTYLGKRLLAHELAHVAQQRDSGLALQRVCEPGPEPELPGDWCVPFRDLAGQAAHAFDSRTLPTTLGGMAGCGEVKSVWDAYFAKTSSLFAFSGEGSCVAQDAKNNDTANKCVAAVVKDLLLAIEANLPALLTANALNGTDRTMAEMPLADAVGPMGAGLLHPNIEYDGAPFNAAGQLVGGVGGSTQFGPDDRIIGGPVRVTVRNVDPVTQVTSGVITWAPNIFVKDTVDFCPGNPGGFAAQLVTVELSRLEASGLTAGVPITVNYDLDVREVPFSVGGFSPPEPGPAPTPEPGPTPGPGPLPGPDPNPTPGPQPDSTLRVYTVKPGDYLIKIAEQFYGDGNKWQVIYEANRSVIGSNPDLIRPGQRLVIPQQA